MSLRSFGLAQQFALRSSRLQLAQSLFGLFLIKFRIYCHCRDWSSGNAAWDYQPGRSFRSLTFEPAAEHIIPGSVTKWVSRYRTNFYDLLKKTDRWASSLSLNRNCNTMIFQGMSLIGEPTPAGISMQICIIMAINPELGYFYSTWNSLYFINFLFFF